MANVNARFDQPIPYQVSEFGKLFLEGAERVCHTCGIDQLASGYHFGKLYYCEEHKPEGFEEQFRQNQKLWDEFQLKPLFHAHWDTWQTCDSIDNAIKKALPKLWEDAHGE